MGGNPFWYGSHPVRKANAAPHPPVQLLASAATLWDMQDSSLEETKELSAWLLSVVELTALCPQEKEDLKGGVMRLCLCGREERWLFL